MKEFTAHSKPGHSAPSRSLLETDTRSRVFLCQGVPLKKSASSPLYSNAPNRPAPGGSPHPQAHSFILAGIFLPSSLGITSSDGAGFQGYNLFEDDPVSKDCPRSENKSSASCPDLGQLRRGNPSLEIPPPHPHTYSGTAEIKLMVGISLGAHSFPSLESRPAQTELECRKLSLGCLWALG